MYIEIEGHTENAVRVDKRVGRKSNRVRERGRG
jgi:hypothetical protein